jgi:hypothetical protein
MPKTYNFIHMTANDAIQKIRVMLGLDTDTVVKEAAATATEVELAESVLVDGTVVVVDGDFEVGKPLFVVTEEGNIPAPEGQHETQDGYIVTVDAAGIITAIEEKAPEAEAPAEEEVVVEEASQEFSEDLVNSIANMIQPLVDDIKALKTELESVNEQFSSFKNEPATGKIKNNLKEYKENEVDKFNQRFAALNRIKKS